MAVTLESLKKSVGKKNSKSKIFAWLADMELAAGDLDTALQRVNGGLTLYPGDIAARLVRSKILFQKEEFEDCVQECTNILVMDPFNLAAQKIMGDAYDRLGNVAERNRCYRRYHDMDPLNKFWKDEYDVIPEAAVVAEAAAVAGAATEEVSGGFDVPSDGDDSLNFNLSDALSSGNDDESSDGGLFEKSNSNTGLFSGPDDSADDESLGGGLFEKSNSGGRSFEKAFGEAFGESSDDDVASESMGSSGLFSSGMQEDDAPAEQSSSFGFGFASESSSSNDDDPFAALAAMLPNSDSGDDAAIDELTASLDSVMDSIRADDDIDKPIEEFPADDNVSGNDVNAALSDMFGLDDDLEAEEMPAPKAADFSASVVDEAAEANASKIFESQSTASADKPLSVDDAFDSIFGEDELPEEFGSAPAASAAAPAAPTPVEPAAEESSLFEKSSSFADDSFSSSTSFEEPAAPAALEEPAAPAAPAPAADKPLSVDDAFDSIFGEDELPDEFGSAPAAPAAPVEAAAPVETIAPAAELADEPAGFSMFEKSADADFSTTSLDSMSDESLSESISALSDIPAVAEAPVAAAPAADKPVSVDDAFGSIFGEDELPEENLFEKSSELSELSLGGDDNLSFDAPVDMLAEGQAEQAAEETFEVPALETTEEPKFVSEVDVPSDPQIASPMSFMDDDSEVGSAFNSIFGADDDLPEEKAENTLVEQVNLTESELTMPEAPVSEKQESTDIAQEMGGAFASMFGDDDDLDLPGMNSETESSDLNFESAQQLTTAAVEESLQNPASGNLETDLNKSFDSLFGGDDDFVAPEVGSAAPSEVAPEADVSFVEKPVAGNPDLASLESEVSGAFKGLFDMEDDALTETPKTTGSGMDFLMSGDSDDEITAGLVKNPDAPIERGALNLDDSMGTRTLAEIYFDQGLYADALKMYQELVQREPGNRELAARKDEIEKIFRDKFGGNT